MATPTFGLFNARSYSVIFAGIPLNDMRAESFLNIVPDEPAFVTIKGADGGVTRANTNNTLFHVSYTVKRSSKDNAILSAILNLDLLTDGGAGVGALLCKDPNGSDVLTSGKAWITGLPDHGRAKDVGPDITWVFDAICLPGTVILGGNQL